MIIPSSNPTMSCSICISIYVSLLFLCCECFHNPSDDEISFMHHVTNAPNDYRIPGKLQPILSVLDYIENISITHSNMTTVLFTKMDYISNSTSTAETNERQSNWTMEDELGGLHPLYTVAEMFTTLQAQIWIFAMIGVFIRYD